MLMAKTTWDLTLTCVLSFLFYTIKLELILKVLHTPVFQRAEHPHSQWWAGLEWAVHLIHVRTEPEGGVQRCRHRRRIRTLAPLLLLVVLLLQVSHVLQASSKCGT